MTTNQWKVARCLPVFSTAEFTGVMKLTVHEIPTTFPGIPRVEKLGRVKIMTHTQLG